MSHLARARDALRRALGRVPRRVGLACVLVAASAGLGGTANAYWGGSGSGSGAGSAGTNVAVTLSPGSPSSTLYPGGSGDVVLTVSNPNLSPVQVGSFTLEVTQGTGGFAVDGGHSGCAVSTLTFTTATNSGSGWTVPAKVAEVNGTLPVTLTNALAMDVAAANACQGAGFTVYLAAGQ